MTATVCRFNQRRKEKKTLHISCQEQFLVSQHLAAEGMRCLETGDIFQSFTYTQWHAQETTQREINAVERERWKLLQNP